MLFNNKKWPWAASIEPLWFRWDLVLQIRLPTSITEVTGGLAQQPQGSKPLAQSIGSEYF